MTYIKICGTTNREDALAAIEFGADALGFIAVQESPRYIAACAFHRIREVLPPDFPLVVVARRASDAAKYHAPIVQYYEDCALDEGLDPGTKHVRVCRIHDADDIAPAQNPPPGVDAVLLDAFHAALLGGSGTRFEWSLAEKLHEGAKKPFLLAGGLNPKNVARALTEVRPYGVDVSSGVEEIVAGKKCHDLVSEFIAAVRAWDAEQGIVNSGAFLA